MDDSAAILVLEEPKKKYTSLIKGSSDLIEPINFMHDALRQYAQSFEKGPEIGGNMDVGTIWNGAIFRWDSSTKYKRPDNTIEALLRGARGAALFNEKEKFKKYRKEMLDKHEKKYIKIDTSSAEINKFIKEDRIFREIVRSRRFENGVHAMKDYTLNLNNDTPEKRDLL